MKAKKIKAITLAILLMIPALGLGQIAPNLNSAADFAVLAATGIAFNGPTTTINDLDIGLYPGTSISGSYLLVDGVALTATTDPPPERLPDAKEDLRLAYLFAAAAPVTKPTISGDQGGLTLPPGVYKSETSLAINDTPLTLHGDENAVWIFQIGSTLTTTAGGDVILTGGAKENNVYWQVGSSATIGDGTAFKGNILAMVSISVNSGAELRGRALARTGAVTFAGGGTMYEPRESQAATGDLTITKAANPTTFSAVNDQIDYVIAVTNTSQSETIENITVTDDLTGLSQLIPSLGPGVSETFTTSHNITAADFQKGFVANIATAKTSDLSESASAYVVVTKYGLLISKVATPKTFYAPGQVIEYDIVVENNGSSPLENILVIDDLTNANWIVTLDPGESRILKTSYAITESDMNIGAVGNTAVAMVNQSSVEDTELIFRIDPPTPVPLTSWAIVLGGILIAGFVFFQYRRSMPNRAQHTDASGE